MTCYGKKIATELLMSKCYAGITLREYGPGAAVRSAEFNGMPEAVELDDDTLLIHFPNGLKKTVDPASPEGKTVERRLKCYGASADWRYVGKCSKGGQRLDCFTRPSLAGESLDFTGLYDDTIVHWYQRQVPSHTFHIPLGKYCPGDEELPDGKSQHLFYEMGGERWEITVYHHEDGGPWSPSIGPLLHD